MPGDLLMTIRDNLAILVLLSWSCTVSMAMLLDGDQVPCPNPATNCLDETFNRVLPVLGCLGCQRGCQPGYTMTANPAFHVTDGDTAGSYDYMGISIPKSKNVSEPQWLCLQGDSCRWGYYADKMDSIDTCSYCGEGCRSCQSYDACQQCVLGYRLHKTVSPDGRTTSYCTSSKVLCPNPPTNCQYEAYASQTVGCLGCIYCDDGYIPGYNLNYRRHGGNITSGYYDFQGLHIAGSVEINEPRYICLNGTICPDGWHNVTRGDLTTCQVDTITMDG